MRDLLAKRYAKALFSIGEDAGQAESFGQEIAEFWAGLEAAGSDGQFLYSLAYSRETRGRALEAVLAKANFSKIVADFFRLLHERGRLGLLGAIVDSFREFLDEKKGLLRGVLTVAAPLDERQLLAIKAALGTFTGRQVELTVQEDPAIIGGVVAKLGDLVLDGGLKSQLDRLSRLLGA
ncbi:MAG: ATP synthase F1 subunit delta [Deltaproteobacteria bacterium]|jgi:F-type H+-transporting ATPase subunit delta|nr:ATP synthase F1 subunit delta [Deltaproteobacteria bacterium]